MSTRSTLVKKFKTLILFAPHVNNFNVQLFLKVVSQRSEKRNILSIHHIHNNILSKKNENGKMKGPPFQIRNKSIF